MIRHSASRAPRIGRAAAILGSAAILLAATTANAHPGLLGLPFGSEPMAVVAAPGAADGDATSAKALCAYYMDLFMALQCGSPTDMADEIVVVTDKVHDAATGQNRPRTPAEVLPEAEALYPRVRARYPVIPLLLTGDGITVAGGAAPEIEFARGLERHVILEVENRTDAAQSLSFNVAPFAPPSPLFIPPGATRAASASFAISSGDAKTQVCFQVLLPFGKLPPQSVAFNARIVEPATIRGTLVDGDSGKPVPGRVYAAGGDQVLRHGKAYADNQTLSRKALLTFPRRQTEGRLPFFYSDGAFEVRVAPGRGFVQLERGFEHKIVRESLDLKPGETREVTLKTGRFLDMKKLGWISGDTHVHWSKNFWSEDEDIKLLPIVQQAEDVRVINNLTLMHRVGNKAFIAPNQAPMGPIADLCGPDYVVQMAEEYRNGSFYGHQCFLNITRLILPISTGMEAGPDSLDYPLNRTAIEQCHEQGGINIEAHNLGPFNQSSVPMHAVTGLSDGFDQMDPDHYYRFLDCGLRIPLSNGSDHPARLVGQARCYVKVDGDFTYKSWIEGYKKRRTFTSSGPLLFLEVDGQDMGSVIAAKAGQKLAVKARAASRFPVGNLQVVVNGRVVAEKTGCGPEGQLTAEVTADESLYIAARCSQTDEYNAINGRNIAHTSAVWVDVDGKPRFVKAAAEWWITSLRGHAARVQQLGSFLTPDQRREAVASIDAGVKAFEALIASHAGNAAPAGGASKR